LVSALRADVAERHVDHEQAQDGHETACTQDGQHEARVELSRLAQPATIKDGATQVKPPDMHEFMRDCDLLLRANPSSEAIDA
jgi:hypothetical protein